MLQSGHKSRRLDFIFELFMECVKFIFYFCFSMFSLLTMNASKETWLKKWTPVCLLLHSNSFPEMIDENNNDLHSYIYIYDQIGVAVQSWLWVWVDIMAWWLSRLECLNGIQCSWVQIPLKPTFYSFFKNPSVVNTICIDSFRY